MALTATQVVGRQDTEQLDRDLEKLERQGRKRASAVDRRSDADKKKKAKTKDKEDTKTQTLTANRRKRRQQRDPTGHKSARSSKFAGTTSSLHVGADDAVNGIISTRPSETANRVLTINYRQRHFHPCGFQGDKSL